MGLERETHLGDRCLCIESDCVVSVRGNLDDKAGTENEDGNRKVHNGCGTLPCTVYGRALVVG